MARHIMRALSEFKGPIYPFSGRHPNYFGEFAVVLVPIRAR